MLWNEKDKNKPNIIEDICKYAEFWHLFMYDFFMCDMKWIYVMDYVCMYVGMHCILLRVSGLYLLLYVMKWKRKIINKILLKTYANIRNCETHEFNF